MLHARRYPCGTGRCDLWCRDGNRSGARSVWLRWLLRGVAGGEESGEEACRVVQEVGAVGDHAACARIDGFGGGPGGGADADLDFQARVRDVPPFGDRSPHLGTDHLAEAELPGPDGVVEVAGLVGGGVGY